MNRLLGVASCLVLVLGLAAAQGTAVEVLEETGSYRLVRHAGGETEVPLEPERIVTLLTHQTEGLLALGLTPVGTTTFEGSRFVAYLEPELEGVAPVGTIPEPSLEAILALEPDLIIGDPFHEPLYAQLSRIAPTVLIPDDTYEARQTLLDLGNILGLEDEAAARIAQFDRSVADAREQLEARLGEASAVYLSARPDGYRLSAPDHSAGGVLEMLGFAKANLAPDERFEYVALEVLPELDADLIFLSEDDPERARELKESPLFQTIPAVREGRVYTVDRELWLLGHSGVIGAEMMVEDVLEFLTGESE